jgi:phosphatidylglycerol:prolipoprotein diacylglycerol transferase
MLGFLDHPNITHDWFTTVLLRASGEGLYVYDHWLINLSGVHAAVQVSGTVVLDIYYLMYLVGFMMVFVLFARWRKDGWLKVQPYVVYDAVLISLTATLIGAKAAYIFIYNPDFYFKDPQSTGEMLNRIFLNWSGMASHGAAFAIVFAFWLWWLKSRAPVVHMGDVGCTAGAFGAICVRLANFLNGELYGRETSVPWAMHFKVKNGHGNELFMQNGQWFESALKLQENGEYARMYVPTQPYHLGYELMQRSGESVRHIDAAHVPPDLQHTMLQVITSPRHPSQLYQLVLEGLLVFSFMIFMRKRVKRAGVLAGIFFAGYAGARFIGEFFREPDKQFQSAENPMGTVLGPLSMGQLLSLGMLAFGVGVIIYFSKRGRLISEIPMWPAEKASASDTLTSDPSETATGSVGKSTVITKAMGKK